MPNYKIVDADQLDADLLALAEAIRAKSGTTAALAFPEEFASAVAGIERGLDTSDATAYATHIFSGYTAYARGQKITGTRTADSIPSDIDAIATGTYTPTTDKTTNTVISHKLGVAPDFFILILCDDISAGGYTSILIGEMIFYKILSDGTSVQRIFNGIDASGTHIVGISSVNGDAHLSSTNANVRATSTFTLKSGCTYRWVAGTVAGIE